MNTMTNIEIIDNPRLKSFIRITTEMGITGFIWGIWVYLLLPIVNMLLWYMGIKYFYIGVIEQAGYKELIPLFIRMGWIMLVIFIIMRTWGYYNYHRYGKHDRRKDAPAVSSEEMADYFQVSLKELDYRQSCKEYAWKGRVKRKKLIVRSECQGVRLTPS